MATDLILTIFSTKTIAGCDLSCSSPIQILNNPAKLFAFDHHIKSGVPDTERFKDFAINARNKTTGRILPNLVAEAKQSLGLPEDEKIGRIATITFSAGRYMNSEILRHPEDREAIDTVIDLDGLNMPIVSNNIYFPKPDAKGNFGIWQYALPGLGPWFEFGKSCYDGSHLMVNWHTQVPGPGSAVSSTKDACNVLYAKLEEYAVANGIELKPQPFNVEDLRVPSEFFPANTPAQGGDKPRTWTEMPEVTVTVCGNNFKIDMPGNGGGAHIFTCHWGQAAVWRALLAPRWNGTGATSGFASAFTSFFSSLTGGGNTTFVNNDSLLADVELDPRWASGEFRIGKEIPGAIATIDRSGEEVEFTSTETGEELDHPASIQGLENEGYPMLTKAVGIGAGLALGFIATKAIVGRLR